MTIDSIDFGIEAIRTLRDEIRQSIYIVKSGRIRNRYPISILSLQGEEG